MVKIKKKLGKFEQKNDAMWTKTALSGKNAKLILKRISDNLDVLFIIVVQLMHVIINHPYQNSQILVYFW